MKHIHFPKKVVAILLSSVLLLILSACSQNGDVSSVSASSAPSSDEPASSQTSSNESLQPSSDSSVAENQTRSAESSSESYEISVYTDAPNENSSIKIQYPIFSGEDFDVLNTLVEFKQYTDDNNIKINDLNVSQIPLEDIFIQLIEEDNK